MGTIRKVMTLTERVAELNHLIEPERTIKAIERFHTDGVTMQENNEAPREGKAICIAHEQQS